MALDGSGEDIVVVRMTRNAHGDPVVESEHTLPGCLVAPAYSTETVSAGEQVTSQWNVYVLADADVRAADRLRRPSDPDPGNSTDLRKRAPWQVFGDPAVWESPWSDWRPGRVVAIRRVSG